MTWTRVLVAVAVSCALCRAQGEAQREAAEVKAQQAAPPKYYRLEFTVKEIEGGKVINSRSYAAIAAATNKCSIRTDDSVPVARAPNTYQTVDIGTHIDCQIKEAGEQLWISVAAQVSSFAPTEVNGQQQPLIRRVSWNSDVIVPLRKPTVIFSSDDLTSKGQMQLEVTATPIK
ncbi:MAG: hypothetical protein JOZ62_08180 [Acidobacteriaceae bacterium]|nr:hypothetical protein [Acidobacteriaceae bacterium]